MGMALNIDATVDAISKSQNLEVILVGRREEIEGYLAKKHYGFDELSIVDAKNVVSMHDNPISAARDADNSISRGISLVRDGSADAFVSVGNTGAIAAAAFMRLGRLPNIERTPILGVFPSMTGKPTAVLDMGANVDCRPTHLLTFSMLGAVYAEQIMERENPKVALLSIGEEGNKGNATTKEAHSIISKNAEKLGINFIGNIEGGDILSGKADVIVCDGFIGNILLKYTESIYSLVKMLFKKGRRISFLSLIGGLLLYPSLKRTIKDFNYAEYGGAPLLGVDGNVVIGHGTSSAKAITNAILLAQQMALAKLPQSMLKAAEKLGELKNENKNSGNRVVRS
ncbi:phosphate acyltransferase PlsX [bacterium]|nr:MAG: phosphate acyltransferase PlsX [bacterium]